MGKWNKSAAILSIVIVLALLAACSGQKAAVNEQTNNAGNSSAAEVPAEIPTVEFMTPWDPGLPIGSDLPVFVEWGKRTGVKFSVNSPPRDAYNEKMNITLASGKLPDIMKFFQDKQTFKDYGPKLFVPLDDYLAEGKLPNFQRWLDKYPEIEKVIRNPEDGKIYGFPLVQDFDWATNLWYVRNDILKKEGLDAANIKTLDDMKNAFLALKKQNGDYITSTRLGFSYYAGRTQAYFGVSNGLAFDPESKKYIFSPLAQEEMYKTWVEFERWMYEEKLLDPGFLTMKDQELFAGYADGKYPLAREQVSSGALLKPELDPNKEVVPIYPIEINGKMPTQPKEIHLNIDYRSPVVISNKSEHIDEIIKAMDYTYSDEGIEFFQLGIEGETFERDPNTPSGYRLINVQSVWTADSNGKYPEGMKKLEDYGYWVWWLTGVVPEYNRFNLIKYKEGEDEQANETANIIQKLDEIGNLRDPNPVASLTKDESTRVSELRTALDTYVSENVLKFILGTKPMSEWGAFINGFDAYKPDELVQIYNTNLENSGWFN